MCRNSRSAPESGNRAQSCAALQGCLHEKQTASAGQSRQQQGRHCYAAEAAGLSVSLNC